MYRSSSASSSTTLRSFVTPRLVSSHLTTSGSPPMRSTSLCSSASRPEKMAPCSRPGTAAVSTLRRSATSPRNQRIDIRHHPLGGLPALLVDRLERRRHRLQRAALDLVHLDAELVHQLRHLGPLEDHAHRARDRIAPGEDLVRAEAGDVGSRRRERAELRHDRLLRGKAPEPFVESLASGRRTARTVHIEDHGIDGLCPSASFLSNASWLRSSVIRPSMDTRAICWRPKKPAPCSPRQH